MLSSWGYRSSGVFCLVWAFICCMICERICYRILSAYSMGNSSVIASYFAKSLGDSLSLDRSQSNLSLMTVCSSRGMSISIETIFLSSVSLRSPSFGLLSLSFCLSSLLKGSMMKGNSSSYYTTSGDSCIGGKLIIIQTKHTQLHHSAVINF